MPEVRVKAGDITTLSLAMSKIPVEDIPDVEVGEEKSDLIFISSSVGLIFKLLNMLEKKGFDFKVRS